MSKRTNIPDNKSILQRAYANDKNFKKIVKYYSTKEA